MTRIDGFLASPCGCRACRAAAGASDTAALPPQAAGGLPYYIDALLPASQPRWNGTLGAGVTVTYSFMTQAPYYAGAGDQAGFAVMTEAQRAAVRLALGAYTAVSGLRFQEVADTGSGGSLRFGTNTQSSSAAYAYYPDASDPTGGDVYIANNQSYNLTPTVGTYGYAVILHEIGHAIGLKHPGNYNATGGGGEAPFLPAAEDNTVNTVMSYTNAVIAETLQPFDVAAVQYLYGVNGSVRVGDDLYGFDMADGRTPLIWDGGGNDTLSAAGQTGNVVLDLRGGSQSWIGTAATSILTAGNLAINHGTVIENAIGGTGNDLLIGNDADNLLIGGAGADTLSGGAGADTVSYAASAAAIAVNLAAGTARGGHATGDSLTGIEHLIGSAHNDLLGGDLQANLLDGGSGSDTVTYELSTAGVEVRLDTGAANGGHAAGDTLVGIEHLTGSAYDDILAGTEADNLLAGGGGNDVLYGRGGADGFDGGAGFDAAVVGSAGTVRVSGVESLIGSDGGNLVLLGDGGNTLTASAVESLIGGSGRDWLELNGGDIRLIVAAVEVLIGGSGRDWIDLGNRGNTLTMAAVETLLGGGNADLVTLGNRGNTLIMAAVETLAGGANTDVVVLGNRGGHVTLGGVETLTGGTGGDFVTLRGGGNTLTMTGVETLVGGAGQDVVTVSEVGTTLILTGVEGLTTGAGADRITLGNRGNSLVLSGVETLLGGANNDLVTLGNGGNTLILAGIETLVGGAGRDRVTLGNRGGGITLSGVETLTGGTGTDIVTLAEAGTMTVSGVEAIAGSGGNDVVTLAGGGVTITVAALETLAGTSGADWVQFGNRGSTTQITGVETLIGGANSDVVILGGVGATLIMAAVETLVGSVGADRVVLGNRGGSIAVSNLETLVGGAGADDVTVTGTIRFGGRGGSDTLRLQGGAGIDSVVFSEPTDGTDTIWNFNSGVDRVEITGPLRTALDRNRDGLLTAAQRPTGEVNPATDELVRLLPAVTALGDPDFTAFRQALGTLAPGTPSTILVLAGDGNNDGLYLVSDDGNGTVTGSEVRLLAVLPLTTLVYGDIRLG